MNAILGLSVYNWIIILGIPTLVIALYKLVYKKIKEYCEKKSAETQASILILRKELESQADTYFRLGHCSRAERRQFNELMKTYEKLTTDEVMKNTWEKIRELPY